MTLERWREVTQIYGAVLSRAPERRAAAVAELCGTDQELRREIESLLESQHGASLLDRPAGDHPSVMQMLTIGSQLGVFRIDSLLGVGGMGEVYRARDTKLNRDVAIKILPPAFANDPDRLARFKREAQMLASLNHPNVGGIYGFEDANGIHALVLELVDGPTLADLLIGSGLRASGSRPDAAQSPKPKAPSQRGLPIDEALTIARQIADALEAAHEQGIIHRDLKPANIKVRDDGTVKVLDFGLAKLIEPVDGPAKAGHYVRGGPEGPHYASQSPTITTPAMTAAGMILGTAAYMSPEQAKGRPADKRSDIWAFGCVLYETLTGKRAFDGEDVSDTLANVLKSEPDWALLPIDTPLSIRRLLARALAKDKRQRTGDAASLRLDIEEARVTPTHAASLAPAQRPMWPIVIIAAAAAIAIGVSTWFLTSRQASAVPAELRVDIATPDTGEPGSVAISPDGTKIIYVLDAAGRSQIVLRELSDGSVRVLPGTDGGTLPFWSPNSRSVAFFARGRLRRIDLAGGPPRDLAAASAGRSGGTWGPDGTILFLPGGGPSDLMRVNENGGAPAPLVQALGQERLMPRGPRFLDDGKHFLFYAASRTIHGVFSGSLDGDPPRFVVDADTNGVLTRGFLLFQRGTTLFAQPFDRDRLEVKGEPFQLADPVNANFSNMSSVSASSNGTVAFRSGGLGDRRQLTWFNRAGQKLETAGAIEATRLSTPNLSHDGRRIAVGRTATELPELWVFDIARSGWSRITTSGSNSQPVWSRDDSRLAFIESQGNAPGVYFRSSQAGGEEQLVAPGLLRGTTDWSSDEHYLLFSTVKSVGSASAEDIWCYSFTDNKSFALVARSSADQSNAKFSPDDRWIAYESNQSGRYEIYLQPFRRPGEALLVSNNGGAQVRWRRDGGELYYVDFEGRLNAVKVTLPASNGAPEVERPIPLFPVRVPGGTIQRGGSHQQYDVSADGERFLVNTLVPDPAPPPITLILNWRPRSHTGTP